MSKAASGDRFVSDLTSARAPVVLNEVLLVIAGHFKRRGMSQEEAEKTATPVVQLLAQHFGGRSFYLPRGHRLAEELRHREIYRLHDGRNTSELAAKYGVTDRQIQKVCQRQRELGRRMRNLAQEKSVEVQS